MFETQEQIRERNRRIAEALGWKDLKFYSHPSVGEEWWGSHPTHQSAAPIPDYWNDRSTLADMLDFIMPHCQIRIRHVCTDYGPEGLESAQNSVRLDCRGEFVNSDIYERTMNRAICELIDRHLAKSNPAQIAHTEAKANE